MFSVSFLFWLIVCLLFFFSFLPDIICLYCLIISVVVFVTAVIFFFAIKDFCNLFVRFIVVDEAHAYKGAFGCHSALILRRLRRLCAHGIFSPDCEKDDERYVYFSCGHIYINVYVSVHR